MDMEMIPIEEIAAHLQTQLERLQTQVIDLQAQVVDFEKYVSKFTESSIKRIDDLGVEIKQSLNAERQKTADAAAQATQAIRQEADTIQKALHDLRLAMGSLAIIEGRIEDLHNVCFGTREDMHTLCNRINDNALELHGKHAEHREDVQKYIDQRFEKISESVFKAVSDRILKQVSPEIIAQALLKGIVVTRQANPYELKEATTLVVRHATPEEIRTGKRTH